VKTPPAPDGSRANAVRLNVSFLPADQGQIDGIDGAKSRLPGVRVPVIANRELLKEVIMGSRSTRFIAFDITGTDLRYETGDHVAIYPENRPELVQRLCDRLGIQTEAGSKQYWSIEPESW
jgi:sulfite reductase alpha subunit-like flavoprotein